MIVLDTSVLSELLRPVPEARVLAWVTDQSRGSVFTTTVTQGEIFYSTDCCQTESGAEGYGMRRKRSSTKRLQSGY
jgi:predicted nucleic acid-binding protein